MNFVETARAALKDKILKTPLEPCQELSTLLEVPVYLKLENLQVTGSFKIRGALTYLAQMKEKGGVACCSAGNHGLAVAYGAKMEGIPCTVYVPKSVDQAKFNKIQKLGAKVIVSEHQGYDETLIWAEEEARKKGLSFISAFDDPIIMAGNGGTLAAEILDDIPEVENFILPIGGGGMAAGFLSLIKGKRIICCQHQDSPSFFLSLKKGKAVTKMPPIDTVAGGIEGGIGANPFEILKGSVSDVVLLTEEEIYSGVRWMLEHHQILIEPSSAVVIAAAITGKLPPIKGPSVFVLSGRNVSIQTLRKILAIPLPS